MMDEKIQDELEAETDDNCKAVCTNKSDVETNQDENNCQENEQTAEAEEEPDEIFFTSDFVLDSDGFFETASYAYLRVANNALFFIGLMLVFTISCLIAQNIDYLQLLPIAAVVIALVSVRRYSKTEKEIKEAHANMVYLTQSTVMHYHITFGEFVHVSNNGRKPSKYDLGVIRSICETPRYWLLCMEQQLYIAVQKDSITGEHPEEFIAYLMRYCNSLKSKKIQKTENKKKQALYGTIGCVVIAVISLVLSFLLR